MYSTTSYPSLLGRGLGSGCISPRPWLTPLPFNEICKQMVRIPLDTSAPSHRLEIGTQKGQILCPRPEKLPIRDSNPMSLAPESMLLAVAPRCAQFPRMGRQLMGREANAREFEKPRGRALWQRRLSAHTPCVLIFQGTQLGRTID